MDPAVLPEIASQDFSLISLFLKADIIVQVVMVMLAAASFWSWVVAVDKAMAIGGVNARARKFENAFWSGQSVEDAGERMSDHPSDAMARVFSAGSREWREMRRVKDISDQQASALLERARAQMEVAVSRETGRLETGLITLAIIATATPFIGLFGTVIGIMNAFRDIAAARETNLAVVAPGIAEALFATAMGLWAAIPALIFFNKLSGDIGKFTERLENFAQEFQVRLSRRLSERRDD
jgi:biopolymer transport protein TolQ